jgi:F-type H+-transporting ATPase subunit gamma
MKAIKRRITSVKNTQQIMKAMNLVAASKVQKSKTRMEAVKPMTNEAKDFLAKGVYIDDARSNIFYTPANVGRAFYVVICGERGLCGSYNANVLKTALAHMDGKNEQIITVGAKCKEYFVRRRKTIQADYAGVLENVSFSVAEDIVLQLMSKYLATKKQQQVDEIYIAHTRFETLLSHSPTVTKLLPFELDVTSAQEVIYEPDVDTYLKKSVPVYLAMFLYGAMVESSLCEQASRMTSMDAAARNAGEIVDDLTLQYNRQRQGAITQEISEIVGGANAI